MLKKTKEIECSGLLALVRLIEMEGQDPVTRASVEAFFYPAFGERGVTERYLWKRVHVFPHALLGSMFGRANPEFRCSLLMAHALASRAVCQPLQVAPSNKWSWVRADNTGHVDLVNLSRGILQNPRDTGWEALHSTNTTFR